MSNPPPIPSPEQDQRKVDESHLKLLAIFHLVLGGLGLLGLIAQFGQYTLMDLFFFNPEIWESKGESPPPEAFLAMSHWFKWFMLVMGIWTAISSVLDLISGFCLLKRKYRMFSLIIAGINCIHIPLGTILGVFTIVVLVRESVKEIYEG